MHCAGVELPNAVLREVLDLLAAPAEDEGVAALQPDDALAAAVPLGVGQEEVVDLLLLQPPVFHVSAALADVDELRRGRHEGEHLESSSVRFSPRDYYPVLEKTVFRVST